MSWKKAIGITIGLAGALTVILHKGNASGEAGIWGDLLIFLNASSYGLYLITVKPLMSKYHPITVIKWVFTFGLIGVIPFGLSIGNRNYLQGLNLIGLRRQKYDNQKIMGLDKAFKDIFASKNLHENLSRINGEYKDNELVSEVIKFIEKDKKRPICSPPS